MTKSERFESMLFHITARHYEESDLNNRLEKVLSDNWNRENYLTFLEPELRELLIDMYERAYEEGFEYAIKTEHLPLS